MNNIVKIDNNQSISRIKCKLPEGVTGIGYSQKENAVVFYRHQDGLFGFVGDDGTIRNAHRRLEVSRPSGMCCDQWGICVFQFSNEMLWGFDQSYVSGRRLCGSGVFKNMSGNMPKDATSFAPYGMCRTNKSAVIIAVPWGNRILAFSDDKVVNYIGSGKKGFSSSGSPCAATLDAPSGVCFDAGSGLLFVSDTGNAVVRAFLGSREHGFIGIPGMRGTTDGAGTTARLSSPAAIKASRGLVAIADGNLVRTFKAETLNVTTPYASSRNIVDLAIGGDSVYVLEEER